MRPRTFQALVLRKHDYSETSQILRIFTREAGVISVLAKGTRREKSSFGGALDLFYRGTATVVVRPRSGLDLLTAFRVDTAHPGLGRALPRFYAAAHLLELLIGMTREGEPYPDLFDRLAEGLEVLSSAAEEELPPVLFALELALLGEVGFAPRLDACAACGGPAGGRAAEISFRAGGLLCPACLDADPGRLRLPAGAVASLRALGSTAPAKALRVRLSRGDRARLRSFLDRFEEWRLERPLRTARFL